MKRNMLAKKLMAGVLTSTMVMSMGMTAFAETNQQIDLTKKVTTDGNTYAPKTTFAFEISNGAADSSGSPVISAGITDGLKLNDANDFSFAPSGETPVSEYVKTGKIDVNMEKFTQPGIYHYEVKETIPNPGYEGINYSDTTYDLYVYITDADGDGITELVGITTEIADSEEDAKATGIEFVNDYGIDNDGTHDVTIRKEVRGNQGDVNHDFTFDISVNGDDGEWYKVIETSKDGLTAETYIQSDSAAVTYTLKDGESIQIFGLSESDAYTVVEKDNGGDLTGYVTEIETAKVNTESTTDSLTQTGTVTDDGATVVYTNTKNVTTPTGIAMTFAPYAVMVVFAGVFAVMFLRKKREDF